jgi:tryptophan synthase alpha chain
MSLQIDIEERLQKKPILLMTHIVLGYPSLEVNRRVIEQMADNGVDCIELQIPFSEPMADGPVIVKANQDALLNGITVGQCLEFAAEVAAAFPKVNFLFMTYYNIVFRRGTKQFIRKAAEIGMKGCIVPDLPVEEGAEYIDCCRSHNLAPIMFFSPTSTDERMREVASHGEGFVYCVARRGVTGQQTEMDEDLLSYLKRCSEATDLPLAVGFGISRRSDVAALEGRAAMAVVGSATIRLVDDEGPEAVGSYVAGLLTENIEA